MAENSSIQWTDHTFNPWIGCTKVSPGCANCYAETLMDHRYGRVKWGKGQPRVRTSAANWKLPLKWNRDSLLMASEAAARVYDGEAHNYHRPRVFSASLADVFDAEVDIDVFGAFLYLVWKTQNLDWLLLSKRLENWRERVNAVCLLNGYAGHEGSDFRNWLRDWFEHEKPPENVRLGTSVENQAMADKRIPILASIPAKVRFLSVEPMLEEIDFLKSFGCSCKTPGCNHDHKHQNGSHVGEVIRWAIFGGESGPGARPCNWRWIEIGLKQCRALGIRPFVKQLGSKPAYDHDEDWDEYSHRPAQCQHCGTKAYRSMPHQDCCGKGHYLMDEGGMVIVPFEDSKGGDMSEWPAALRVREFPV